jgi:tRNA(Ile)-lysidine synthase TilS/MesJ
LKLYGRLDGKNANKLGVEAVSVPENIRGYENVATWTSKGQEYSSGFVIQIYRKNNI